MELYDEEKEKKKSKLPMIIGISIGILVLLTVLIITIIIYLNNSIKIIQINGIRNNNIEEMLYIETSENGLEVYMPITRMSQFFGYEGYNGDYKDKSEDKTKCHVISENEIAMFSKDSDILVKITEDSEKEYIQLDKPVFEKDGELYTTIQGIEKAFNVAFSYDSKFKDIKIYTMDFLIQNYATALQRQEYSGEFNDKKAIFEKMLIIGENRQYGVIDITTGIAILETKYEAINFLPSTKNFLVKSNGKYGTVSIGENNEVITKVKPVYDELKIMDNQKGLYLVKQNGVYGIVDTEGQVIIEPEYKQIGINIDKYAQNGVESKYVLLDEVIPVKNNENLWGFFNLKGEKVIDFRYTGIGCEKSPATNSYPALVIPSNKIIVVAKDKNYNLVTTEGEELINGYLLDSVYLKTNATNEQAEFFMTTSNNTKVINIGEWLTSIGE